MHGQLIPCGGGDEIPLLKTKLLIGRRSSCDITLEFPNVSSHHCELEFLNGYWCVRDLGSRNGVKVNGERHDSKWLLPGDELTIAKHRFHIEYTPTTDAPPPEEHDPFALTLMEKAGLMGRRASSSSRPIPRRSAPKPAEPEPPGDDDESKAMEWLSGD